MSKKNKQNKTFSKPVPPQQKQPNSAIQNPVRADPQTFSSPSPEQKQAGVRSEHISLLAHQHIQQYLQDQKTKHLSQEDLNAVLRLSQHLRVFGLLSAAGYVNQSNDQDGKVRQRTVPVWTSLLSQLMGEIPPWDPKTLMDMIQTRAKDHSPEYLALWSRSLTLSNHWCFWARAYFKEEKDVHGTPSN